MPHIVATITDHGLGHLSISAPVINRLYAELADSKFTLITGLPKAQLHARISVPFDYLRSDLDFGMHNDIQLLVRIDDTVEAYRTLHDNWQTKVEDYAQELTRLNADLLFSNVSYLSLAAAKTMGIPSVALSPLNWADMYQYFCQQARDFSRTHAQILEAYRVADMFLLPTPSMPMPQLSNTKPVGPVAAVGSDIKHHICEELGIEPSIRLALVAMGGHDITFPVSWPRHESVYWLVTPAWDADQPNVVALDGFDVPFLDLLASCDLLVSKPGYGAFTEATCAGKPVLYVRRPDWPEESHLISWLEQNNRCRQLTREDLSSGGFIDDVLKLMDHHHAAPPPTPTGVNDVTRCIEHLLRGSNT